MKFKTQIIETREGNLLIVSSNLTEGAYFSKNLDYLRGVDDPQEEWNWATTAWDNAERQYQKIFDESIFPKWKYFRRWKISYGLYFQKNLSKVRYP
jgi:hypothetical protein